MINFTYEDRTDFYLHIVDVTKVLFITSKQWTNSTGNPYWEVNFHFDTQVAELTFTSGEDAALCINTFYKRQELAHE